MLPSDVFKTEKSSKHLSFLKAVVSCCRICARVFRKPYLEWSIMRQRDIVSLGQFYCLNFVGSHTYVLVLNFSLPKRSILKMTFKVFLLWDWSFVKQSISNFGKVPSLKAGFRNTSLLFEENFVSERISSFFSKNFLV